MSTILMKIVVSYSNSLNNFWVKCKVSEYLIHLTQGLVLRWGPYLMLSLILTTTLCYRIAIPRFSDKETNQKR